MNKKISLDLLKIILTPREMKNVLGGSDPDDCEWSPGTCGWSLGFGTGYYTCNASKAYVTCMYAEFGGNWCCDNCDSASYC